MDGDTTTTPPAYPQASEGQPAGVYQPTGAVTATSLAGNQPGMSTRTQEKPPAGMFQPPAGAYQPSPATVQSPPGAYQSPAGMYPAYSTAPPTGFQQYPPGTYPPQPGMGYGQPPTVVVTGQPVVGAVHVVGAGGPPDYTVPSVLVCLFCFWPTGLCAVYYAFRAKTLASEGKLAEAQSASNTARTLMIVSVVLGVAFCLLMIILAATGSFSSSYYRTYY